MPTPTTYNYTVSTDFPGGAINVGTLELEIEASSIITALDYLLLDGDSIDIRFKDALSAGDKTTLDGDTTGPAGGLIAAHDSTVTHASTPVHIDGPENSDGSPIVQTRINRMGYYLCDRDVKVSTAIFAESGAVEDLRVDPATHLRSDWGEVTLNGVYKDDGGTMVACTDQADADTNAICTVVTYQAKSGGTPILYELRGGALHADPATSGWENQVYALAAPQIPLVAGGQIPFFDGYLAPYAGDWMESVNPVASVMDPSASALATEVCVWIYYPAGVKLNHVLRFVTYRPPGS